MVNEEKSTLNDAACVDEKRFYKDELDESGYFRSDYIPFQYIKGAAGL